MHEIGLNYELMVGIEKFGFKKIKVYFNGALLTMDTSKDDPHDYYFKPSSMGFKLVMRHVVKNLALINIILPDDTRYLYIPIKGIKKIA
jgi:hypothetical protein